MQTDIILESEVGYVIVDAKYYSARSAESAPGWPDIAKQMFYEKALREIVDSPATSPAIIDNIFVFPSTTNDGPLSQTEMLLPSGNPVGSTFSPIRCSYVSVKEALRNYVSYTQGIQLIATKAAPTVAQAASN